MANAAFHQYWTLTKPRVVALIVFTAIIGMLLAIQPGEPWPWTRLVAGGLVAALALFRSDFWFFAAGLMLIGLSGGFTQKIRFAAADASPSFYKGKAISWILAGGIVSAVLGPQLAIWAKDYFAPVTFAGTFMALVPLAAAAILVLSFLRLPQKAVGHDQTDEPPRPTSAVALR